MYLIIIISIYAIYRLLSIVRERKEALTELERIAYLTKNADEK